MNDKALAAAERHLEEALMRVRTLRVWFTSSNARAGSPMPGLIRDAYDSALYDAQQAAELIANAEC